MRVVEVLAPTRADQPRLVWPGGALSLRGKNAFRPLTVLDGPRVAGAAAMLLTLADGELALRVEGMETWASSSRARRKRILVALLTHALIAAEDVGAASVRIFVGKLGPARGWPSSDTWYGAGDDNDSVREVCQALGFVRRSRARVYTMASRLVAEAGRLSGREPTGVWRPATPIPRLRGARAPAGERWLAGIARAASLDGAGGHIWALPDVGPEVARGRLPSGPLPVGRAVIVMGMTGRGLPVGAPAQAAAPTPGIRPSAATPGAQAATPSSEALTAEWILAGIAAVLRPTDGQVWFTLPGTSAWTDTHRRIVALGARPVRVREELVVSLRTSEKREVGRS